MSRTPSEEYFTVKIDQAWVDGAAKWASDWAFHEGKPGLESWKAHQIRVWYASLSFAEVNWGRGLFRPNGTNEYFTIVQGPKVAPLGNRNHRGFKINAWVLEKLCKKFVTHLLPIHEVEPGEYVIHKLQPVEVVRAWAEKSSEDGTKTYFEKYIGHVPKWPKPRAQLQLSL